MDTQERMAEPGGNQPHSSPSRALPVAASACWHCHKCLGLAGSGSVRCVAAVTANCSVDRGRVGLDSRSCGPNAGCGSRLRHVSVPVPLPAPATARPSLCDSPFPAPATSVTVCVTVPLVCQSLCHSCYHSPFHTLSLPLSHLSHPLSASASAQDSAGWPVGHSSHYTAELSLSGRHPADGSCNSRLSGCVGLWEGGWAIAWYKRNQPTDPGCGSRHVPTGARGPDPCLWQGD